MKKILFIMVVLISLSACTRIDSANIGFKISRYGTDKGKPKVVPAQGVIFYNPFTTSVEEWKGYILHKVWTKTLTEGSESDESINVTSSDGGIFNIDCGINYQVDRSKAIDLYLNYRIDLEDIVETRFRNTVRKCLVDIASKYRSDSLIMYRAQFEHQVEQTLDTVFESQGLALRQFTIIDLRAPSTYAKAIEDKIKIQQQTLQAQAQEAQAHALAQVKIENARGDAEAQRLMKEQLSAELLQKMWIEKWNGQLPTTVASDASKFIIPSNK